MATHELKTWPAYFEAVGNGIKTFEIRNDRDRGFQAGDKVILREYNPHGGLAIPESSKYTGRQLQATIGFVTAFDQKEGYVVFSLLRVGKPK